MKNLIIIGIVAIVLFLISKNKMGLSINGNTLLPLSSNPLPSTPPTTPGSTSLQTTGNPGVIVVDNSNDNGIPIIDMQDDFNPSGSFTV